MPRKIAVLAGGESSERKISLFSGKFVLEQVSRFYPADFFDFPQDRAKFIKNKNQYVLAIPVFHGRGGEDGQIQGFLTTLKIPFTFSDIEGHAIGMNKVFTNIIAESYGVKTPKHRIIFDKEKPKFKQKCVAKPIDDGSSINVFIVNSQKKLDQGLNKIFQQNDKAIIEEFISGKEYTVGVIEEEEKQTALPVIYIKPRNKFFDYESKYTTGMAEEICPALIDKKLSNNLQKIALLMHRVLGLKHFSRSDFIVDRNEQIWFLEINTIPGLTKNSLIPKAIKTSGRDFGLLLKDWIESTLNER